MATFKAYKKRRELVAIGVEASPGVVAVNKQTVPWLSENVQTVPGRLENESGVGSNRRVNDSAIDVFHSEGPLGGKVSANIFAILAHGMLNKVVTVDNGDGTYTHTLTRDDNAERKSLSYWVKTLAGTRLFKSVYLDNLNVSVEAGENGGWLEFESALKGWRHEDVADLVPVLPSDFAKHEYVSRMVKVYLVDTVADLATAQPLRSRSLGVQLEETATPVHHTGIPEDDGTDGPEFDQAPQEAKASVVVTYRSDEYEQGMWSNKQYVSRVVAENGNEKIEITATKTKIVEGPKSDGRDDTVTQSLSLYYEDDWENGGQDVQIKITNTLASLV